MQEALTNVIKHSGAQHCTIRLRSDKASLHIEVADDGKGLPRPLKAGVGLQSMRERAEELGGHFSVNNPLGGGAVLKADLPLMGAIA